MRQLIARAVPLYLLLRALVTVAMLLLSAFGSGNPLAPDVPELFPPNPPGFAILLALVGAADIRRRRETMFWRNLGYGAGHTAGVFAVTAVAGEGILAIALILIA